MTVTDFNLDSGRSNIIRPLKGEVLVPSDKSLVHRAVLLASIAEGTSVVRTNAIGRDNLATIRVMQKLGVSIVCHLSDVVFDMAHEEKIENIFLNTIRSICDANDKLCELQIEGRGLRAMREPLEVLYCGNSGTTARLLLGLLAAAQVRAQIDGDESLRKRPFKRVTEPLGLMGASFDREALPLRIERGVSKGISYISPKASAQVKSAVLIAGLGVRGNDDKDSDIVSVREPVLSRDHTERMLGLMGCSVSTEKQIDGSYLVKLPHVKQERRQRTLKGMPIDVAGDFSAASFVIAAALLVPGSDVIIKEVGFNPTRIGFYHLLIRMGGNIEVISSQIVSGEEIVDLRVFGSELSGIEVSPEEVVYAIDEVPILAVCAAFAHGETTIRGAEELRVKESDRLNMMYVMLRDAGFHIEEFRDGLRIDGNPSLLGSAVNSCHAGFKQSTFEGKGDHRIAMCASILEYLLSGALNVIDGKEIETSFPGFYHVFSKITSQEI